jgi:hypothetical protein
MYWHDAFLPSSPDPLTAARIVESRALVQVTGAAAGGASWGRAASQKPVNARDTEFVPDGVVHVSAS